MIKTHLKQATRALVLLLDNAQKFTIQNEKSQDQEETKKPSVLLRLPEPTASYSLSSKIQALVFLQRKPSISSASSFNSMNTTRAPASVSPSLGASPAG